MPVTEIKRHSKQSKKAESVADSDQLKHADTVASSKPERLSAEVEIGGRKGLEPTRYGDWEKNGRCIDF
jgi:hypothetical protein